MAIIHSTAIVHEGAQLHETVEVGAYSVICAHVKMGAGTKVGEHCVIDGHTIIGENNVFYRFCSVGGIPQDKKYKNEETYLEIGNGNTFREFVTINTGTTQDVGVTRLGDDNWIMAYTHIAHDCQIGSHVIIANAVQLAGHVHIGDWAIIGGMSAAHQFIHIGAHSMTGGMSSIRQDIPPYVLGAGQPYHSAGINSEGLKRRGYSAEQVAALREAYKIIFMRNLNLENALKEINVLQEQNPATAEALQLFVDFFSKSGRGIARK